MRVKRVQGKLSPRSGFCVLGTKCSNTDPEARGVALVLAIFIEVEKLISERKEKEKNKRKKKKRK